MSISMGDLQKRHRLREKGCCKIKGCKQRGRLNYGVEFFYHGFCKDHYSQYQEGLIDFFGNFIRMSLWKNRTKMAESSIRKKGVRWNKKDHVQHKFRCKIVGCERLGETSHGKTHFFKGFCAYHYRDWFLKGFMDIDGNIFAKKIPSDKSATFLALNGSITPQMVKKYKNLGLLLG